MSVRIPAFPLANMYLAPPPRLQENRVELPTLASCGSRIAMPSQPVMNGRSFSGAKLLAAADLDVVHGDPAQVHAATPSRGVEFDIVSCRR